MNHYGVARAARPSQQANFSTVLLIASVVGVLIAHCLLYQDQSVEVIAAYVAAVVAGAGAPFAICHWLGSRPAGWSR